MQALKLNSKNLSLMEREASPALSLPRYNRNDLSPSIVHIGLGNFHRAHQAFYLDQLLEKGLVKTGISAINIIPDALPLEDILREQDFLYTLITKSSSGEKKVRVSGSIIDYLNGSSRREAAIRKMADKRTLLITLTVTERGYYYNKNSSEINADDPAVKKDLKNPAGPITPAAYIAAALKRRYTESRLPLTIMSCDNLPSNGKVLKNCVLFFCRQLYPEILSWAEDNVAFPSSMVDRITPVTTPELSGELEGEYKIIDRWPVSAEDYIQWVLEDNFKTPLPCYEEAGVQLVKDAGPYELMKMRLLNGSHSALAYPSCLLGLKMVEEGISHPLIKTFIRERYMEEVSPTLAPVPGIDLDQYKGILISRFSNKNIADTTARLAGEGTSKIPNFILGPLSEAIRQSLPCDAIIFALAAWARYLEGKDEEGRPIEVKDSKAEYIKGLALGAREDPAAFLAGAGLENISEAGLNMAAGKLKQSLNAIYSRGIKAALKDVLEPRPG